MADAGLYDDDVDVTPNWTSILAAAIAVVGTLSATVFTQVWTSRREDRRRAQDQAERASAADRADRFRLYQDRRAAYVHYLKALHDGSEAVRAVVLGEHPPELTKELAAGAGFRNAGVYSAREDVVLLANPDLAQAAREAFFKVRDLRDLAAKGADVNGATYQEALNRYQLSLRSLRVAMRADLKARTEESEGAFRDDT